MLPRIDLALEGDVTYEQEAFLNIVKNSVQAAIKAGELSFNKHAELSILLADDSTLQSLNREWRDKDKPTNVLSFPAEDITIGEPAGLMIGDIAISIETASREAALENKMLDAHLSHLVVHGFLHLFGYDHETDEEAEIMENLERRALADLGIADPYDPEND